MRFLPTDDQNAMAEAVRDALAKECTPEVLRASWDSPPPPRLWQSLAELGLFGLVVDERFGGLGGDERDAVGVIAETGRAAVPGPVAETFAASYALRLPEGSAYAERWMPMIAAGKAIVSLGLLDASFVVSADRADLLVLQHETELHAVPSSEVRVERQESVDGNRRLFSVAWEPCQATVIAAGPAAAAVIAAVRDHLLLALSAQLTGLARQLLDLSVRHVSVREQFGRPLGAFQAVQHRLADVAVGIEFAVPVVERAACSLAAGATSASRDVAMAKVFASQAAERAAYSALQVHGAIGYTREHDLHLYALRAWTLALAHGDARRHRARVADDLLGPRPALRFP
jgi:alkylation response protein AidB-like acyl-CoA dehydrogenase